MIFVLEIYFCESKGKPTLAHGSPLNRAKTPMLRNFQEAQIRRKILPLHQSPYQSSEEFLNLINNPRLYSDDQAIICLRGRIKFSELSITYSIPALLPSYVEWTKHYIRCQRIQVPFFGRI